MHIRVIPAVFLILLSRACHITFIRIVVFLIAFMAIPIHEIRNSPLIRPL